MKTLLKPLFAAFAFSFLTASVALADGNPSKQAAPAVAYKTGIYTTAAGKLHIALDKEKGGVVDITLKNADGKILYAEHVGKKEQTTRLRLNLSELQDGTYQVEITNGTDVTTHSVTLSTNQPGPASRLVAFN